MRWLHMSRLQTASHRLVSPRLRRTEDRFSISSLNVNAASHFVFRSTSSNSSIRGKKLEDRFNFFLSLISSVSLCRSTQLIPVHSRFLPLVSGNWVESKPDSRKPRAHR